MANRLLAWGPAAAWAAVLFLLSAWPIRLDDILWFPQSDKVAHVCLYIPLGVALAYARLRETRAIPHVGIVMIGAFYGASDEWHQSFVPGRSQSLGDWVADVTGVVLGYGLAMLLSANHGRRDEAGTRGATA